MDTTDIEQDFTKTEKAFFDALKTAGDEGVSRTKLFHLTEGAKDEPEDYFGSNVVDVHIKTLRKKLLNSKTHVVVETIRGFGYKMVV